MISTPRLRLRELTTSDVDELVALDADPEVMRFLTNGKPTARSTVADVHLPWDLDVYARHPGLGRYAAELDDGTFVGWFALTPREGGALELGYRLRREVWGSGLATEGSLALLAYAFARPETAWVYAETMAVNRPSRRVLERIGLRYVRTFHVDFDDPIPGTEHGEVEYAITRSEWHADQSGSAGF